MKISEIKILPRQRKDLTSDEYRDHIDELAASIEKHGLLQPVVVNQNGELVAGFTRIQAHLRLDRESVPVRVLETLDSIELKEMELEENVRRRNLEWFEEAAAIAEIHALKKEKDPDWTISKTAEVVGKSGGTVSQSIDLVEASKEDPDLKNEKTLTSALNKRKYKKKIESRQKVVEKMSKGKSGLRAEILVGDAMDLIQKEEDETFDAVISNFPFGVELEYRSGEIPYKDDEKYISHLIMSMCPEIYRVLREDSWLVAFFDIRKITYCNAQREFIEGIDLDSLDADLRKTLFESMGLTYWLEQAGFDYVQVLPATWVKPNKKQGFVGDPSKGMISSYEAFVIAGKGEPVLMKRGLQNIWIYDTPNPSERVHSVQMPVDLCADLVSLVCLGGANILDPFAGSGSIGLGALENQCSFRGYELNPEYAKNGNMRLKEHPFAFGDSDA